MKPISSMLKQYRCLAAILACASMASCAAESTSRSIARTSAADPAQTTSPATSLPTPLSLEPPNCTQFAYDLFAGAYAIVRVQWLGSHPDPTTSGAFEAATFVVDEVSWLAEDASAEVRLGEQRLATLIGLKPTQFDAMRADAATSEMVAVLVPSEFDEVPWRIGALIADDRVSSGDVCSATYTEIIDSVARGLQIDTESAVKQFALFLRHSDSPEYRPVADILAGANPAKDAPEQTP